MHEFGHYWVARRLGFKVLRFSVGFGKPLLKHVAGADRVEYVIAAMPLGGYVKMLDEREGPVAPAELPRSFTRRPPWQRIVVLLAGPAFNIVFAVLVLLGHVLGRAASPRCGRARRRRPPTRSPARAGLKRGDEIVAINGMRGRGPARCGTRSARCGQRQRARSRSACAAATASARNADLDRARSGRSAAA